MARRPPIIVSSKPLQSKSSNVQASVDLSFIGPLLKQRKENQQIQALSKFLQGKGFDTSGLNLQSLNSLAVAVQKSDADDQLQSRKFDNLVGSIGGAISKAGAVQPREGGGEEFVLPTEQAVSAQAKQSQRLEPVKQFLKSGLGTGSTGQEISKTLFQSLGLIPETQETFESKKDINDRLRFTEGPNAEKLVFPDVKDEGDEAENKLSKLEGFKAEDVLRDQFVKLSGSFVVIRDAFQQIRVVANQPPSPAGDLSLIFSYMKMLDPTSVIREGEQATAKNAKAVPDRIKNIYNSLILGKPLTPEQRTDFKDTAERIFKERGKQHQKRIKEYTRIAGNRGLNAENVIVDLGITAEESPFIDGEESSSQTLNFDEQGNEIKGNQ